MNLRKTALALLATAAAAMSSSAQNGIMSPYSRYGIGQLRDNATAAQQSMGGIGYAMNSGRQINVMNPASYARIDSMTFLFDMGIDFTSARLSENEPKPASENHYDGGLNYITMQFPMGKYMGASIGLLPYSSVGYSFSNEIKNGSESRSGGGSLNLLYAGASIRPLKDLPYLSGFSVGANVSYMFGTVYNDTYAYPSTGQATLFERQIEVRDYHLDFGAQYEIGWGYNSVTLGAVYSPGKALLGHYKTFLYDPTVSSESKEVDNKQLKDSYSLPETWGGGVNYRYGETLMLEADVTWQPWSKAKFPGVSAAGVINDNGLSDRYKFALGGQYVPGRRGSYLRRINYRAGAFYTHDYITVRGNNVREFGVSAGLGLPVPSFKTMVNLGVEWSQRRGYPQQLVKENNLYVTLGINFNEAWFRKSRIY